MTFKAGQIRQEVVACLAAADVSSEAAFLSQFGPIGEEESLMNSIEEMKGIPEESRVDYIVDRLKSLVAREEFRGLAEIHPAWLVEVLSKESPRVIGIVLRYLPSKQVRYIIEHLSRRIKHRLPQLIDSFAVPGPILKIIRERFERQFISEGGLPDEDTFEFDFVRFLKSEDLLTFFRDLGVHELAMALKGVDNRSLNILFNRLSVDEARALQQRIRSLTDVSPSLLREAKYTVLEMNLTEADSDDLLMDIGLNAFSRALFDDDRQIFPLIKQKLEPRLGYTLKRYIDQHIDSNVQDVTDKRKEVILERIKTLVKGGSLDENLSRYFGETKSETPAEDYFKAHSSEGAESWQAPEGVV